MIRVAAVKKPNNELHIKAFSAQDFEDAEQAARDSISSQYTQGEDIRIDYPEFFLLIVEYFVTHNAEKADAPVVHSRVLSDEDRKFLRFSIARFLCDEFPLRLRISR